MATEKRLIRADVTVEAFTEWLTSRYDGRMPADIVDEIPTVDAVEVVRCKDCTYWKPGDSFGGDSMDDMQRIGGCPIMRFARRENDFCCEGERRTNAQE